MNILLLGPIHREKEFLAQKGKKPFLIGQGQQSWVDALQELGHKVTVFRYTDSVLYPKTLELKVADMLRQLFPRWYEKVRAVSSKVSFFSPENWAKNNKLLSLAQQAKPDVIIISGGISSIFPQTMQKLKQTFGCKVFLFSGINPLVGATNAEKAMVQSGLVDVVVDNDCGYAKKWKQLSAKQTCILPISSVDPAIHKKLDLSSSEQKQYGADVVFVGTLSAERQQILSALRNFGIKIWGDLPPTVKLDDKLQHYYLGNAHGEEMVKIFNAAKIVLNFQPKDMLCGGNMRTFEIPGCGALQLADRIDSAWFTDKKEYVRFTTIQDLQKKISYYLTHATERKRIAQNGYKRARKKHTYAVHLKALLDQFYEKNNSMH